MSCSKEPSGKSSLTLKSGNDKVDFQTNYWIVSDSLNYYELVDIVENNLLFEFVYNQCEVINTINMIN